MHDENGTLLEMGMNERFNDTKFNVNDQETAEIR